MASTGAQLSRLHAELDELSGPSGLRQASIAEALASAAESVRQPTVRTAEQKPALTGLGAAALAAAAGGTWLATRWRHRRPAPRQRNAPAPAADAGARGLRRRWFGAKPVAASLPGERPPVTATPPGEITDITRNFLLGVVVPIWLAAGVADWVCHRRARIEDNAGSKESVLHLTMLAEAAVPVIAGMVLEITSPMLLLMFAAVLLHSATGLLDVSYAMKRRTVTPIEQHVHSYLEMVPVMATAFVTVLHWPELRALLGFGNRPPDWSIRRKSRPLPTWAVAVLLTSMVGFEIAPYIEEYRRTRRH